MDAGVSTSLDGIRPALDQRDKIRPSSDSTVPVIIDPMSVEYRLASTAGGQPIMVDVQRGWMATWPLRRKLRALWVLLVTVFFCTLPLLIWEMQLKSWNARYQAWFVSGLFVLMCIPITFYEIALHLEYYSQPQLQKHIIRILLMVPIYALDSWFCLRFMDARIFLTPIRESYEAYTIYNFLMYLIRFLEGHVGNLENYMENSNKEMEHLFPMNYVCGRWVMGKEFYRSCRKGVLNYVLLRPTTTAIMVIALLVDPARYEEGSLSWRNIWLYTAFINSISQCWAIYCLALFYVVMHNELVPINPLRKFVVIKLVVFFSFWQGFVISVLVFTGALHSSGSSLRTYNENANADLAGGLQDFIICVEMFIAALAFAWSFPPREFMNGEPPGFWSSIHTLMDLTDVVDDVQDRMNEEYRDMTSRPLSRMIDPIRNVPFFNPKKSYMPVGDQILFNGDSMLLIPGSVDNASSSEGHRNPSASLGLPHYDGHPSMLVDSSQIELTAIRQESLTRSVAKSKSAQYQ